MEGEARREEEEGIVAVLGEEGVEGRGTEEAAQRPGDGGDGDERGERQAGEDALLEVRREHVPRAAVGGVGGHGRGSVDGLVADHGAVFGGRKWRREKGEEEEEREGLVRNTFILYHWCYINTFLLEHFTDKKIREKFSSRFTRQSRRHLLFFLGGAGVDSVWGSREAVS